VHGMRVKELLEHGDLDEALRQLRRIEMEAGSDDTNSILMTANLERMRLRERQQELGGDQIKAEKAKLIARILSVAESLEREVWKERNDLLQTKQRDNVTVFEQQGGLASLSQRDEQNSEAVRDVLLLVHGIQTRAGWFDMVRHVMLAQVLCEVTPIKYDYFDIVRFLLPIGTRGVPIRKIAEEIRRVKMKYPNARLSAIAHSFGTYALMHALDDPTFELSRVILCGSILPERPRLQPYFFSTERTCVVNDYGTRDIWPVLAKCFTWGFGATGTFGFGTVGIRDRAFPFSHSEFFSVEFVRQYWVPFIRDGTIVPPQKVEELIDTSQFLSILGSPIVAHSVRLLAAVVALSVPFLVLWKLS
jgi:hypothetical protein